MKAVVPAALSSLLFFLSLAGANAQRYTNQNAFGSLSFTNPLAIVTPPGETNRVFVVEQRGVIVVITNLAAPTRSTFLDISGPVVDGGEQGLLGLAFHPGYASNRYFYVFYTAPNNRLSRFEISVANSNAAVAGSELILINQPDDAGNHNGGDLHFGADGYLYLSLGDEGGANDQHNNSQVINKDFFSGILRLDVDKKAGNLMPNTHSASSTNYFIPADNPFVGATSFNGTNILPTSVRTEFWAVGLRNPWRMSFDRLTGRLYVGDVGQGAREEVDIITRGGNYGWAAREGFIAGPKPAPPTGFNPLNPIFDYGRGNGTNQGASITGGVVYRGAAIPELDGHYVFADYVSGNIWALFYDGTNATGFRQLLRDNDIVCFGLDPSNGDVLLGDLSSDQVKRLVKLNPSALERTLVPAGARWKYLDNGTDQQTAWRGVTFDDRVWVSGPAELGYGEGDEATVVASGPPSPNRFITTYFRHAFEVADPSIYSGLQVGLLRDDGGVVYLNGVEVFRSNMPTGLITHVTGANNAIPNADETAYFATNVSPALLRAGTNVVAVEIHQVNGGSSDVSFNLYLTGEVFPVLSVGWEGTSLRVWWPAPSPGYFLETSSTLGSTASWSRVLNPVTTTPGTNSVTVATSGASAFYRLAR